MYRPPGWPQCLGLAGLAGLVLTFGVGAQAALDNGQECPFYAFWGFWCHCCRGR